MDTLYRWQPSIAKIGKKFYWTVWRYKTPEDLRDDPHDDLVFTTLTDGFADERLDAVACVAAILKRENPDDPSAAFWWASLRRHERQHKKNIEAFRRYPDRSQAWLEAYLAEARFARLMYQRKHARKPVAKRAEAQTFTEFLWGDWFSGEEDRLHGDWFPVIKKTAKRIIVRDPLDHRNPSRYTFDRQRLEATGEIFRDGVSFRTEARRKEDEAAELAGRAPDAIARRVRAVAASEVDLLGLPDAFDRDQVVAAFRDKALIHHPDQGGDAAMFRQLVAARDRVVKIFDSIQRSATK